MNKKIDVVREIPKMKVGRYMGKPVDQLPNSYLRWMLTQDFPKEYIDIAKKKLNSSPYSNEFISVSRHCIDQFSLRFIELWLPPHPSAKPTVGLASYIVGQALLAWESGVDVSKKRYENDGVCKELDGIVWVFKVSETDSNYKDVITCYQA